MVAPSQLSWMGLWLLAANLLPFAAVPVVGADDSDPDFDLSHISINNASLHDGNPNCSYYVAQSWFTAPNDPSLGSRHYKNLLTGGNLSTSTALYFDYYTSYDFRTIATKAGEFTDEPDLPDSKADGTEDYWPKYRKYFNSDRFLQNWSVQNWSKDATKDFPVPMQNSRQNVYISQFETVEEGSGANGKIPDTYLTLRTNRAGGLQIAAEMENLQKNVLHATFEIAMQVRGDEGAVAGAFFYRDGNNELDIEKLTRDGNATVHFSNQPVLDKEENDIPGSSLTVHNSPLASGWVIYRIDWVEHMARYYVRIGGHDVLVAEITHSVPKDPMGVILNMWSDGGEWSGNMTDGGVAYMEIAYVNMAFNVSGPVGGADYDGDFNAPPTKTVPEGTKVTETICRVDNLTTAGVPEVSTTHVSWAFKTLPSLAYTFLGVVLALALI